LADWSGYYLKTLTANIQILRIKWPEFVTSQTLLEVTHHGKVRSNMQSTVTNKFTRPGRKSEGWYQKEKRTGIVRRPIVTE
jgi:hypothetical protein